LAAILRISPPGFHHPAALTFAMEALLPTSRGVCAGELLLVMNGVTIVSQDDKIFVPVPACCRCSGGVAFRKSGVYVLLHSGGPL
jgi:hypothetical protein